MRVRFPLPAFNEMKGDYYVTMAMYKKQFNMRLWCNGSTTISKIVYKGSIPFRRAMQS